MAIQGLSAFYLIVSMCLVSYGDAMDRNPAVKITRRLSGDYYYLYRTTTRFTCPEEDSPTYIVTDGQCIDNQDLINSKDTLV